MPWTFGPRATGAREGQDALAAVPGDLLGRAFPRNGGGGGPGANWPKRVGKFFSLSAQKGVRQGQADLKERPVR